MKTLAVYHKQLGDTLLLQPALAKLAAQDGEPVGLVTRPHFTDLVSLMPGVVPLHWQNAPRSKRLICYDAGDRDTFTSLWCRAQHKTLLSFSSFYLRIYHPWIFDCIHLQEQGQIYRARYFWDITQCGDTVFEPPQLRIPPPDWKHPKMPSTPFILAHPTSAWQRKCWPAKSWRELIAFLRSSSDLPIVLTGGRSEWERTLCAKIAEDMPEVLNLGGETNIRGIITMVSKSAFVVTVDGFMSHLALAYRKPCVTLFGPTNANHWHLETEWSQAVYDGNNPAAKNKNLEALSAQKVIEYVNQWLEKLKKGSVPPRSQPSACS